MRRLAALLLVASTLVAVAVGDEEQVDDGTYNCMEHNIYECAYPGDIQKFHAVSSKAELEPLCQNLHGYLRCIDNYTKRCLLPAQRSHFNRMFSGTTMVIHEICKDGHYQKEFLKHAVCMKGQSDEFDACADTYHHKIEFIEQNRHIGHSICCPLREYMTCLNTHVKAHCGEVTANFSLGFNQRLFHAIMTTHCSTEENDCSTNGSPWNWSPDTFTLFLIALAIFARNLSSYSR